MTREKMIELLERMRPTVELLAGAAESVRGDNHDETDTRLVKAIKKAVNAGGVGPRDSMLLSYYKGILGVSTSNALGAAKTMLEALEDEPEKAELLKKTFTKSMGYDLDAEGKRILDQFDLEIMCFLWALFQQGILHGIFLGWRGHEIALLETSEKEPNYVSDNPNVAEVQGGASEPST